MDAQSIYEMPSVSRCLVFIMLSLAALDTAGAIVCCDRKTIKLEKEHKIISSFYTFLQKLRPPWIFSAPLSGGRWLRACALDCPQEM